MAALSFIGVLFPLLFLGLIVLIIGTLVAGRGEADTTGRRPYAIYLSLVTFIGLVTTLGSAFAFTKALGDMLFAGGADVCPPEFMTCGAGSGGGGRSVLVALLILAVAGAFTYLHGQKLLELRGLEPGSSSPAARVLVVFGYAVCFVTAFGVLVSAVVVLTSLVDIADPSGGFGGGRGQAGSTLISTLLIGVVNAGLFRFTWQTFDLGLKQATQNPPPPPFPTA